MAVMKVFAGPPGTGKTYSAAREAVELLAPGTEEFSVQNVHNRLIEEGRIIWVTFHPSYSYEDFVEGYRPEETPDGNLVYSIVSGPFLRACQAATARVDANRFQIGETVGRYRVEHVEAGGVVLAARPNRKDQVADEEDEPARGFVDFWTLRRFADQDRPVGDLRIPGKQNERKQTVARELGLPTTFFANSSRHAAIYEALQEGTRSVASRDVVLVIDEINRADLSRVFGELITLLEFDKRQGASEERQVDLTYSGRPLSVPPTLSIIGTMNTADKSLSTVDLALRRRFEFVYIPPNPDLVPIEYGGLRVRGVFEEINRRLSAAGANESLIGHADFMESKLEEWREREGFTRDDDGRQRAFASVILRKTLPYIEDLFRGDRSFAQFVLGNSLFYTDEHSDLEDALGELGLSAAAKRIEPAPWWDPRSGAWDSAALREALATLAGP